MRKNKPLKRMKNKHLVNKGKINTFRYNN